MRILMEISYFRSTAPNKFVRLVENGWRAAIKTHVRVCMFAILYMHASSLDKYR